MERKGADCVQYPCQERHERKVGSQGLQSFCRRILSEDRPSVELFLGAAAGWREGGCRVEAGVRGEGGLGEGDLEGGGLEGREGELGVMLR